MSRAPRPAATSRRRFLQALGSASLMPFLSHPATGALPPAGEAPSGAAAPPPAPTQAPAGPVELDQALAAEARGLADILQRRYGERFDDAALHALRADVEGGLRDARALCAVRLQNADEPAVVFRALPLAE